MENIREISALTIGCTGLLALAVLTGLGSIQAQVAVPIFSSAVSAAVFYLFGVRNGEITAVKRMEARLEKCDETSEKPNEV